MNGERETPREIARGGPRLARTCLLGPPSFTRDRMPAYLIRFLTRCIRGPCCLHADAHTFSPGLRCSCRVMNHHPPGLLPPPPPPTPPTPPTPPPPPPSPTRQLAPRSAPSPPSRVEPIRSVAVAAIAVLVPRPPSRTPSGPRPPCPPRVLRSPGEWGTGTKWRDSTREGSTRGEERTDDSRYIRIILLHGQRREGEGGGSQA